MTPSDRRAVAYGLIVTGGLVAADIGAGKDAAISGAYALGAIVAGVLAGFRPALVVALVALPLAALSGIWNDDFGDSGYTLRFFVACCASMLALGAGRLRDQNDDQLARQELLGAVADLPRPGATLDETVARMVDLLVPRYATFAALEVGLSGEQVRLGARGAEPGDGEDSIDTRLRARDRDVGCLTIAGGRSGAGDPEFLRVLAGRVALALDNAGLSQELVTVEQQLQAILENLGEAVTVQDRSGRLVFANSAAAVLLGADSVAELLSTAPQDLVARFTTVNEDGSPLDVASLPGRAVLEGREAEPLVVRVRNDGTGEERWRVTKSTPVRGPGGDVLLAVNVIEDITESKRAELGQRLLAEASAVLASSVDYRAMLQQVVGLVVPALADWCSLSVTTGERLEPVAVAAADDEAAAIADQNAQRGRAGMVMASIDAGLIVAPMMTAERISGAISFGSAASGRRFGAADLQLALELGRRAATAIENARLYTQLEDVATTLQRSLLPPPLPEVDGWQFRALYLPAGGETEVGGDFYDVFPTAAGWMAVMGDVVGRGAAAASLTAMGRYTLRTAGSLVGTPTMGLARLNDNLRERGDMALCTVAVILLREDRPEASLVCAGHPLPYLIRGGVAQPVGRTGPLLGAFEQSHWLPATLELQPGDVIVLYTDGVTDARGEAGRFGDERLAEALNGVTSADEVVDRIRSALRRFAGFEQDDDTAVLAMQKL